MIGLEQIGAPAFLLAVGPAGKFRYLNVNAAYRARTGVGRDDVLGRSPYDVHDPLTAAWLCEFYQDAATGRRPVEYDIRITLLTGDLWWRTTVMPIVSADGVVDTLLCTCQDVTTEKRLGADLLAKNQQLDLAIRMLRGATWRFDVHANHYEVSPNVALLLGDDQPRNVDWSEWAGRILPEDLDTASCACLVASGAGEQTVEFRFLDNHGATRWARCLRFFAGDAEDPVVCGVVVDITAERERAAALEIEATRDSLTGLLNRRGLKRAMPALLASGAALIMIDLDGFKQINDVHGHLRGDAVLVAAAERLAEAAGHGATLARLGGDEFLAILRTPDADAARQVRQRISDALAFAHEDAGRIVAVSASVGMAWADHRVELAPLLADADDDLYRIKRTRKAALRSARRAAHGDGHDGQARAA